MIILNALIGLWTTTCLQTQINNQQGWVREQYAIEVEGSFEFSREWFKDAKCDSPTGETDLEKGNLIVGKPLSGMFAPPHSYEVDFHTDAGTDLGAITIVSPRTLRFARGWHGNTSRNTMVGLFQYNKI